MSVRTTVLPALLVALASAGGAVAQMKEAPDLTATGTVVSTGNTSLVVKNDELGQSISFIVGTTTVLPPALPVGSRVTVHYHPVGTSGQMADRVVLLDDPAPTRPPDRGTNDTRSPATTQSPTTPPASPTPVPGSPEEPDRELPSTASPLPLVGLVGLAALVGGLALQALGRRRS